MDLDLTVGVFVVSVCKDRFYLVCTFGIFFLVGGYIFYSFSRVGFWLGCIDSFSGGGF